jgi:REP element-mobilizing transposase RayT
MLNSQFCQPIHDFIHQLADHWGVKVYRFANVGNHIHLLIKVPSRATWRRFIRELSGGIAIIVTGARKGAGLKKNESGRGFWDELVFTRIVKFGRDFVGVKTYLAKNLFEAAGIPMKKLLAQGYRIVTIKGLSPGEAPS